MSKETDRKAVADVMGMFIPNDAPVINHTSEEATKQTTKDLFKHEVKTRRVQIVMKPSIYEDARLKAVRDGYSSFNDYVNTLIMRDLNRH